MAKSTKRRAWNSTCPAPSKPLARGAPPKRKTKPKAVNRARKAKTFERAYGGKERRDFVASLRCIVPRCGVSPCDPAHTSGDNGAGYKASAKYLIPLCRTHHDEQHDHGAGSFAIKYQINLRAAAAATEQAWQDHINRGA